MKPLKTILSIPLVALLVLTGCRISDDMSHCPPDADNVTLLFALHTGGGDALFRQAVEMVDVAIFDAQDRFVAQKHVSQSDLASLVGTNLTLPQGTYRIVCWGNAATHSSFEGLGAGFTVADATLLHTGLSAGTSDGDDPMYYAPRITNLSNPETFLITVPKSGSVTRTIDFTAAHNTVEVFIKGYQAATGPATMFPGVEITSLAGAYDFTMNAQHQRPINFYRLTGVATINSETMAGIRFHTAQFENDNPILVHIKSPDTGQIEHTINLKQFLSDNNITLDPTSHDLIRIMVEFKEVGIDVTVPHWGQNPVDPEF